MLLTNWYPGTSPAGWHLNPTWLGSLEFNGQAALELVCVCVGVIAHLFHTVYPLVEKESHLPHEDWEMLRKVKMDLTFLVINWV